MAVTSKNLQRSTSSGDKTLAKGLQILEALSHSVGPRGISDLAKELSLTKSNVHRLLQTLAARGYVTKDTETDRYLLSSKLWRLSQFGQPFHALREAVRPVLRVAAEKTSDSVLFAAIEGDELLIVDQVETRNVVRVYFSLGQSFRIDKIVEPGRALTALQLVALAYLSFDQKPGGLLNRRVELNTVANVSAARLAQIRREGFAISRGGWLRDVSAVVVPVLDVNKKFIGVLSCFGPATRFTENKFSLATRTLAQAAHQIRDRLD